MKGVAKSFLTVYNVKNIDIATSNIYILTTFTICYYTVDQCDDLYHIIIPIFLICHTYVLRHTSINVHAH